MIRAILLVGLGGAIGSMLRFMTSVFIGKYYATIFPIATWIVNLVGCFLIGLVFGLLAKSQSDSQDLKWFLITGFCGGFTTFSAFSFENIKMIESSNFTLAFANIALSVVGGLTAVWLGLMVTK